jgi:hypothetical protein
MCEEDLAKRQEYEKECSCYEIVRGTARIPSLHTQTHTHTPGRCSSLLTLMPFLPMYCSMVLGAEVTPEIAITRARYKAPFPVTSREVVAFR